MAYATVADVQARAGRLAAAWTDDSSPDTADIELLLRDVAAEIDARLVGRGATLPLDETASAALVGLNADGALVLAIEGTFGGRDVGTEVEATLKGARARYQAGMKAIEDGKHAVVVYVDATSPSAGADDFWSSNPDYPLSESFGEDAFRYEGVIPARWARRGQRY